MRIARILHLAIVAVAIPLAAEAQTSITAGTGRDAIASGNFITISHTSASGAYYTEFTAQSAQGWVIAARNASVGKIGFSVGPSAGFLEQAPWVGPYVLVTLPLASNIGIEGLYWPAIFPDIMPESFKGTENPENMNIGHFGIAALKVGPVKLSYAGLDFLHTKTNWLPGVSYTHAVNKNTAVTTSITKNTNEDVLMYSMSLTYSFGLKSSVAVK